MQIVSHPDVAVDHEMWERQFWDFISRENSRRVHAYDPLSTNIADFPTCVDLAELADFFDLSVEHRIPKLVRTKEQICPRASYNVRRYSRVIRESLDD